MRIPFFTESEAKQESDEKGLVAQLEELYKIADGARRAYEPEWYQNILYLQGRQWESLADDLRMFSRVIPEVATATDVKITNNQVYPLVRAAATGFRDFAAKQKALPATEEQEDEASAELATDFLQWRLTQDNEYDVRFNELLWILCTGRVLRMSYWDPQAQGVTPTGTRWKVGDIKTETLNVWQFHQSPWVDSAGNLPWVIVSDVRDIAEINEMYPGHDVKGEEFAQITQYRDLLLTSATTGTAATPKRKDAAILKRLFLAPTPNYPEGRYLVWANEKLLSAEHPLPEGRMPFVALDWFPIPGVMYPLPFVSPLRDLQKEGNLTLSQWIDLKNRQLRGDMVVRGGFEPPTEEETEEGRKIVRLDATTQEFEFLKYDLDPAQAVNLVQFLWDELKSKAGVHEPSLGETTTGTPTAFHIAALKEADQSGLGMFRSGLDKRQCDIAKLKLLLAQKRYQEPRMLTVTGRKNRVKTQAFFGSDLEGTHDVISLPVPMVSQAQKMQLEAEAHDKGLYGPYVNTEDMFSKLNALRKYPIPDVEDEVEDICEGMGFSFEEFAQVAGQLRRERMVTEGIVLLAERAQATAMIQMAGQAVGGPEAGAPGQEQQAQPQAVAA